MSRYNHPRKAQLKEILYRCLGVIAVTAILAFFLPQNSITTHEYRLGEPWDDAPIIAKDSFLIYKTDDAIQAEKDSLLKMFEPYYQMVSETADKHIAELQSYYEKNLREQVPDYYLKHLEEKLREIYLQGIADSEELEKLQSDGIRTIRIYRQNNCAPQPVKNVFSEKSAYEFLMQIEDSVRFSQDKMYKFNLNQFLEPNLTYDTEKSQQERSELEGMVVPFMGQVLVGQKIVDRGDIITENVYCMLHSLEIHLQGRAKSQAEKWSVVIGRVLMLALLVLLLLFYFLEFRKDFLGSVRHISFVVLIFLFFTILTFLMVSHNVMSVYLIPYCILPIFIRVFIDSRTAFATHIIMVLTCAMASMHPYEIILTQAVAGLVVIYSLQQLQQRSDLFRAAIAVTCSALAIYACIDLVQGNFFSNGDLDRWNYIFLCVAGIISLIAYLLLIPIERIFGFTSSVTLVELSNINNTVLRRLSEEAPGTFQHSMQVANLAAEVANGLGAKSQLVRTGALYHDIGKLENAVFFTENQSGVNPHEGLTNEESAKIILQHVQDGLKLAEKYQLPSIIKEFIATHHGKSMAKYFYISSVNSNPGKEVDKSLFTYSGPNPHTQEQAILMMADAVEAASRSLPEYTESAVNDLVNKIIDGQVNEGYFNFCPLTFLDVQNAKEVFKAKLKTIYHTRIQYPDIKSEENAQ